MEMSSIRTAHTRSEPFSSWISTRWQVQGIWSAVSHLLEQSSCDEYSNDTQSLNILITWNFCCVVSTIIEINSPSRYSLNMYSSIMVSIPNMFFKFRNIIEKDLNLADA
jgi:hypothetical protein